MNTHYLALSDERKERLNGDITDGLDQSRLSEYTRWPVGRPHPLIEDGSLTEKEKDRWIAITEEEVKEVEENHPELAATLDEYAEAIDRFTELGEQLVHGVKTNEDRIAELLPQHMYEESRNYVLASEMESDDDMVRVEGDERRTYSFGLRTPLHSWIVANYEPILEADDAHSFGRLLVGNAEEAKEAASVRGKDFSKMYQRWRKEESRRINPDHDVDEDGNWYDNLWELVAEEELIDGRTVRDVLEERREISQDVAGYLAEIADPLREGAEEKLFDSDRRYQESSTEAPM